MGEHTPTPWVAMGNRGDIISVCKGFPERVVAKAAGQTTSNERAANAALIVRAVNAHAQIVAALEQVLQDDREFRCCSSTTLETIEAALASLKESAS